MKASEAASEQSIADGALPKVGSEQIWVRVPASMVPEDSGARHMKDPVVLFVSESQRPTDGEALKESFPVCSVARAVPKKEVREVEAADKACKAEWHRFCWDVNGVKPWREVRSKGRS